MIRSICAMLVILGCLTAHAAAQSSAIGFQAKLTGVPDGPHTMTFSLYDVETGGTPLQTVGPQDVVVQDGIVSTAIGFDQGHWGGLARWIGLALDGIGESSDRIAVASVPYSLGTRGVAVDAEGRIGVGREPFPNDAVAVNGIVSAGPTVGGFAFRGAYSDGNEYDYNGRLATFFRLIGGPTSAAGFGVLVSLYDGGTVASPVVWLMNQPNNSFDIRSQLNQGGLPGNVLLSVNASGETQCGASTQPAQLSVFGNGGGLVFQARRTGATMVKVLEITGGSDLAEPFDVAPVDDDSDAAVASGPVPGMVMSIDAANPGKLRVASEPYDTRVAGVISGANGLAPGMVMGKEGDSLTTGEHPVAMTGRVWVLADATLGPIAPGDRLTSSSTPGYAMKAADPARADGAVIGKAMTGLGEGRGMVLVLVNLQ